MMHFKPSHLVLLSILAISRVPDTFASDRIYRFDMGPADSPLADGYQQVDEQTRYTPDRGFGWVGDSASRKAFHRTVISPLVLWRQEPSATSVDGVTSPNDLVFEIDIPNGRYTVETYLGDIGGYVPAGMGRFLDTGVLGEESGGPGGPLYSMAVACGNRTIAAPIETRTLPHRGTVEVPALARDLGMPDSRVSVRLGNYQRIRFTEQVDNGKLKLRFFGDESVYRKGVERLREITDRRTRNHMLYIAGGPFTANSVLAIVVRPFVAAPLVEEDGILHAVDAGNSPLQEFATAFNARNFRQAARAINEIPNSTFEERYSRILARMWLVGHPNHWREREAVPQLERELDAAFELADSVQKAELNALKETLTDLKFGLLNFDTRTKNGQELVSCMNRAEGYFARAQPGEPFYWKFQLYRARIWYSMDPNRNAQIWRKSEEIMRDLEKVYPDNRWVRYYLHDDPSGWPVADYRLETRGAPEWASEVHNFYNRILDLSEWWMSNRQDPDTGAIGGEWGDDVELMPLFAYTGFICPDASPLLTDGTRVFVDGLWSKSGIVDTHNGFFHITSDAEHASEFTGNVLGMLLHLYPGDPIYLEHSLKTAKLMRDLWMGRNAKGQRLVRSGYLGAFHVPNRSIDVDATICGRAFVPAWNVLELNRNPEIARLVTEYADTLRALAMTTDKGKPAGVLPGPIVYETGELGSPGSKDWWRASEEDFQGMFSFPEYHGFRWQVLTTAWRLTGKPEYLEPIRLEAEFVQRELPNIDGDSIRRTRKQDRRAEDQGSLEWVARQLAGAGVVKLWEDLQAEMRGTNPETTGALLNKDEVAAEARDLALVARKRWPMMTDDATMTDRVAFGRSYNSTVWYSGARLIAQQFVPSINFDGPGREFAALVLRHNPRYLKLLYYGFHDGPKLVRLHFWELEPRGTYRLTGGPDENGDDMPDAVKFDQEFVLSEPTGGVELQLPPDRTFVFEVKQVQRGQAEVHAADPAISPRDIQYDPRGHLLVDVHNIGNMPAEDVSVEFYDGDPSSGGKLLGRTIVSHVEPPNTLQPQVVRTGIQWTPGDTAHEITVVLDAENHIQELFERNNKAQAKISKSAAR